MIYYNDIRDSIKSGDVLAWSNDGFQAQIVRIFTKSKYSHTGIAWVVGGRVFTIDAALDGVRIAPLSKHLPFYWIPTENYWNDNIEEFALTKVGDKYSKWDAIFGFLDTLEIGGDSNWQCAEFVIEILKRAGVLKDNVQATPAMLIDKLQDMGFPIFKVNGYEQLD